MSLGTHGEIMPIFVYIRETSLDDTIGNRGCGVCVSGRLHIYGKLTDVALPEKIALTGRGQVTRKFPIDFIFDAAHGDESGDNASPTACLH